MSLERELARLERRARRRVRWEVRRRRLPELPRGARVALALAIALLLFAAMLALYLYEAQSLGIPVRL